MAPPTKAELTSGKHDSDILWGPQDRAQPSNLERFAEWVSSNRDIDLASYSQLWTWSTDNGHEFWGDVWNYYSVGQPQADNDTPVLQFDDDISQAEWFPGFTLNFAEFILRSGEPNDVAIIGLTEQGLETTYTWADLRNSVQKFANVLDGIGVGPGDVIAGYLPNLPETMIAFLGSAAVGATWSVVGVEYSPEAAADRFRQLNPKVLLTSRSHSHGGRIHDNTAKNLKLLSLLTSVETTVEISSPEASYSESGFLDFWTLLEAAAPADFKEVPFAHPLWIVFSSGTTGKPKAIIHSHGGVALEMPKTLGLHWNLSQKDVFFWYTSPSWIMWNINVAALFSGATVICYSGSPTFPDAESLWKISADYHVTLFGTSPKYLELAEAKNLNPYTTFELDALTLVGCTGSPLNESTHRFYYDKSPDIPVVPTSGGTDVVGPLATGAPTLPTRVGQMSCRPLGVKAEVWNQDGNPIIDEPGELVVTQPMPSMPIGFWGDQSNELRRESYFSYYPGVWRQGDLATLTSDEALIIHGRSDATINRSGVRIGPADIYNVVDQMNEVNDSLVVGVELDHAGYWMPLFIVPHSDAEATDSLALRIMQQISTKASKRHVPDDIIYVDYIPRTKNGKRMEVPVKRILQGVRPEKAMNWATVDDERGMHQFVERLEKIAIRKH